MHKIDIVNVRVDYVHARGMGTTLSRTRYVQQQREIQSNESRKQKDLELERELAIF
jgi:hypothetical protein